MGIFKDIGRAASKLPGNVASAVTGKKGILGKKGTLGLLMKGKVQKAAAATGRAVTKVTGNHLLQGAFPGSMVPAAIVSAAVGGGPKGALKAVKKTARNPVIKAELAALGVLIPPLAPASAAAIAGMEATSRVVDGINSKDPRKIAAAAMQVAGTQLLASQGNAHAKRALTLMKDVNVAQKIAMGKTPGGLATIKKAAKGGNKKAKSALGLVQFAALRNAAKTVKSAAAKPAAKKKAAAIISKAQVKKPALTAGTFAALASPKGIRVGDFSLLRTGRILYKGKPVRKKKAA